ncbi:MAG TPA: translocation/assembly module TamB domain-containing protein [Kofleriaceae bacterium]|nr:translocation/assembly module TamB domain-containing protein [Kofleriaceae bacterium]
MRAHPITRPATVVKPKRPLWKRIVRGLGWTLGGVILLVVLLVGFLHTSWGKSFVRGRIESKLSAKVNGEVHLGSLDYGFLFGTIELGDLEIKDASGQRAIAVGSVAVDLDRSSILDGEPVIHDLAVRGLDVHVVKLADGRTNLTGLFKPSDSKPLAHVTIEKLSLAGTATITKPDGSTIAVRDLSLAGTLDARPASKQLAATLSAVSANVALGSPTAPPREVAIALDRVTLGRRADGLDVDLSKLSAGALGVDAIVAHVGLVDGKLQGAQEIRLHGVRVDRAQLAAFTGKDVLANDVALELAVTGPHDHLVLAGTVTTGSAKLALDGEVELAIPKYRLALVGTGLRSDLVKPQPGRRPLPEIETGLSIQLAGTGKTLADLDAQLDVAVADTRVGKVAIADATLAVTAKHGDYTLVAHAPGLDANGSAKIGADRTIHGRLALHGDPDRLVRDLHVAVPPRITVPSKLDLAIAADGQLDGVLAVQVEPTKLAVAGGQVSLVGTAQLERRVLQSATAKVGLEGLQLAAISRMAGRPPKLHGSLSGSLALTRTGTAKRVDYDLAIALDRPAITVGAKGSTDLASLSTKLQATRRSDRAVIGTAGARLPLARDATGKLGLAADGAMQVDVELAKRTLADLGTLLPPDVRAKLPAGDVALVAHLSGTPARPAGTIAVDLTAARVAQRTQKLALVATLSSTAHGTTIATDGQIWLDATESQAAKLSGTIALPALFHGGKLDVASARKAATLDLQLDIPTRELASLAYLRPKLAQLGGTIGGRAIIQGGVAAPHVDAKLAWAGYRTATGTTSETTLSATGTPAALDVAILHGGKLAITAAIARTPDRITIDSHVRSPKTPLLPLVPAFVLESTDQNPGELRADLDGRFTLVRTAAGLVIEKAAMTGGLDLDGGEIVLPHTDRHWRDIALHVAAEPGGLRIQSLSLSERDIEKQDRKLTATGLLAWNETLKPQKLTLELAAKDWLVFGGSTLGQPDAPRGAANFDLVAVADLTQPTVTVDATVKSLALLNPDRLDRGHQQELASVSGDIIYLAPGQRAGKLPVAPRPVVAANEPPKHRRPIDIRVHIPNAIRINQAPFDLMAHGELAVTVRDEGVKTRGALVMERGTLGLFGREHQLVSGQLAFTDEHPHGWLDLTFARKLPNATLRGMSRASAGDSALVIFSGPPTKPKTKLGGASNAALAEVMAAHNAGRPVYLSEPDMPASETVQAPRGDQLQMLTFMASNLPHLLFMDRVAAWADPYDSPESYGRIENLEAMRVRQRSRVKAVTRPHTPGRSSAELQWDRLLLDTDRTAFGVGVRGGSRGGGGIGLFLEWSSDD